VSQDAERLPEGFERISYDADTQTYTFRDADGNTYKSEPGSRYGQLHPVGSRSSTSSTEIDSEAAYKDSANSTPARSFGEMLGDDNAMKKENREAVRAMLPFALLIFIFLLVVFKLLYGADAAMEQVTHCGEGSRQVQIAKGDTCWAVAESCGVGVEDLLAVRGNEKVDCDALRVGQGICVPA
jgi:hypothetical protein